MNKNQLLVIKWLSTTGHNFLSDIVELEGDFESIPEDVAEAFATLSDREKIEVIQKAANNLLYQ